MLEGTCEICFNTYDEKTFIPKVLDCGHSFCNICITNMLKRLQMKCPNCRKALQKPTSKDYPTNFSLLDIAENSSNLKNRQERLELKIECLKFILIKKIDFVSKVINDHNSYRTLLEEGLLELNQIDTSHLDDIELAKCFKLIHYLEIEAQRPTQLPYTSLLKSGRVTIEINLENFNSTKRYLFEVNCKYFDSTKFNLIVKK